MLAVSPSWLPGCGISGSPSSATSTLNSDGPRVCTASTRRRIVVSSTGWGIRSTNSRRASMPLTTIGAEIASPATRTPVTLRCAPSTSTSSTGLSSCTTPPCASSARPQRVAEPAHPALCARDAEPVRERELGHGEPGGGLVGRRARLHAHPSEQPLHVRRAEPLQRRVGGGAEQQLQDGVAARRRRGWRGRRAATSRGARRYPSAPSGRARAATAR